MSGATASDVIAGIFFVTIVYVLARPQSNAAQMLEAVTNMLVAVIRKATDLAQTDLVQEGGQQNA